MPKVRARMANEVEVGQGDLSIVLVQGATHISMTRPGRARPGTARPGEAGRGEVLLGTARPGEARLGRAGRGKEWLGESNRFKSRCCGGG